MSEPSTDPTAAPAGNGTALRGQPISVLAQYLKDFSFESPNAPGILVNGTDAPQGRVQVDVRATPQGDSAWEVSLKLNVEARHDGQVAYLIELDFAGLFQIGNVPNEAIEPLIMIEAPRLLFPYARAILSNVTRDAGFAPILVNPIDFAAIYREHRQQAVQTARAEATADGTTG